MRKITAVILSSLMALLAPGPAAWAAAIRIAAPKTGPVTGTTGAVGIPGASVTPGLSLRGPAVGGIGTFGVLPGGRSVEPSVSLSPAAALALPVSPAILQTLQTNGVVSRPVGLSPAPLRNGQSLFPAEVEKSVPETGNTQPRSLIQSLKLPSLFRKGGQQDLEAAKNTGETDFNLHIGGAETGGNSKEERLRLAPPAERPSRQQSVVRWAALARMFNSGGTTPGRLSGILSLNTPDRGAQALKILPVTARDRAAAPQSPRTASRAFKDQVSGSDKAAAKTAPRISPAVEHYPAESEREYRSAYFPLTIAALSATLLTLAIGVPALIHLAAPALLSSVTIQSVSSMAGFGMLTSVVETIALALGVSSVFAGLYALWESLVFTYGVATRVPVTDAEFQRFLRKELNTWDLHPSVRASLLGQGPGRGILKPYRPPGKFTGLAYGFTAGGSIYLRPEMIRSPWLFRWVLRHELTHLEKHFSRGPPQRVRGLRRLLRFFFSEFGARFGEFRSDKKLRSIRIPVLDRVLNSARLSLQRTKPYEVLIIHPGRHEVRNSKTYAELSGGLASVVELETVPRTKGKDAAPDGGKVRDFLKQDENDSRFRMVVYPQSFGALPENASNEDRRLRSALKMLDKVYVLSRQLPLLEANIASPRVAEMRRLMSSLGVSWRPGMSTAEFDKIVGEMYFNLSRQSLQDSGFVSTLESVYSGLHHRGSLLLPFAPGEPGLDTIERLMRYWRAEDGGGFSVMRVDLPEGGHVLVARKNEPRVDLWLRPANGQTIAKSHTNVNTTRLAARTPEELLRSVGFTDADLERFRDADMEVRHIFGADVGDNRIYVNVRRNQARLLQKYAVGAGIQFRNSERFDLHLIESGPLHKADKTWKLGFTGKGGRIYDVDTGLDTHHPDFADRDMTSVDFVDEGPEDWIGHGTHKAGISYANGTLYKGMAPQAEGRMGKVFAQDGRGASDGEIMAAAVDAMQWGADVISLSLGSPGAVEAPLAEFFSNLTKQKNSKGEYPIVTGSAGNSGPFNNTKSQPSVGEFVASIAAAAKSLDDGEPEISFYSSVGPAYDRRFGRTRYRRPFGLTALGGDVTTPPGVTDVYSEGIESVKSKDMPKGPSDAKDGRHTRMSGTSMSNPMIAGIALLVKQAAKSVVRSGTEAFTFLTEHLPFAVTMILMRSSEDMRVPIFFQEGGFVDAEAAVQLGAQSFGGDLLGAAKRTLRTVGRTLTFWRTSGQAEENVAEAESPWDWIRRARTVWDWEDHPYVSGDAAREQAMTEVSENLNPVAGGNPDAPSEDPRQGMVSKQKLTVAGNEAMKDSFEKERGRVVPKLLEALKDKVWIVRMYAAYALLNLRAQEALLPLLDAALTDSDQRVRQVAFLAIAETPGYAGDEALRQALSDGRPDVEVYAAYALARHGSLDGIDRIVAHTKNEDKKVRFTSVWLLGQLGRRAPPAVTDALAGRVIETTERGNIRHLSVASLTEVAKAAPEVLTDESILNLLYSSGPDNFALTRTISKFFSAAASSVKIRERMVEKPLRDDILKFIHRNKSAIHRPGALGEMVRLLSGILNVPLDTPTPLPNPNGVGVAGVDPHLGPVHLIVDVPQGVGKNPIQTFEDFRGRYGKGEAALAAMEGAASTIRALGLGPDILKTHSADLQAAMPASQTLWFNVPDAKVTAFVTEMESRGYRVRRAAPMYRLTHDTGKLSGMPEIRKKQGLTGDGVLVAYLDEGGDTEHPAIPKSRIPQKRNFTDDGKPDEVEREGVSHGTHGMGIVGAQSVEGSPYEGMASGVKFAIGKVLGETGGSEATVMAGMEWAASLVPDPLKEPVIINMSLGGPGAPDSPLSLLVNALRLKNIGVVTAAGNSGPMEGTVSSPANAALAISVGAVDKEKNLTDYSSRSPKGVRELSWVDFGGAVFFDRANLYEIVSALNTRLQEAMSTAPTGVKWKDKMLYHTMSGTSMAAPHTTGKLAVLVERMHKAYPEGLPNGYLFFLESLVERTATAMTGHDENEVGAGLIDEGAALSSLEEALKDKEKVRFESETLILRAAQLHGHPAEPVKPAGGWFQRMTGTVPQAVGTAISSLLTLFLVP